MVRVFTLMMSVATLSIVSCGDSGNNCSDERFESLEVCIEAAIQANNNCGCVLDGDAWIQLPGN